MQIKFFLLFLLLLISASAEFNAYGETTIQTTPCKQITSNITIQNTEQTDKTYSISIGGTASQYITFSAINFKISAKQAATITTFYNIPCDIRPETYQAEIYFNDGEIEKVLYQEIEITIPDNILANITPSQLINPCETAKYELNLYNPADFPEIYTITTTGYNLHISEPKPILQSKENRKITLKATPEDCTQTGTFPITLKIQTEKSNQQKELLLDFIIKNTDIPEIASGINKIRTDYQDSIAEFTLQNKGDRETTYILSTDLDWATITPKTITILPGDTATLQLRLTPSDEAIGNYETTITATVDETGIQYDKTITIKLQPPTFIEKNPAIAIIGAGIVLLIILGIISLKKYVKTEHYKKIKQRIKEYQQKIKQKKQEQAKKKAEKIKKKIEQHKKQQEIKKAKEEKYKQKIQKQLEKEYKQQYLLIAKKEIKKGTKQNNISAIIFIIVLLAIILAAWNIIKQNLLYVGIGAGILVILYSIKKIIEHNVITIKRKLAIEETPIAAEGWKKGFTNFTIIPKDTIKNLKILIQKIKPKTQPSPYVYQTITIKTNTKTQYDIETTIAI